MGHVDTEILRSDRSFVRTAMRAPLLDRGRERDLARQWRERADAAALHALVGAHLRLVVAMAVRFRRYGLPLADLIQEGNLGLMQAAARFDPARDVRFSTYAMWWIRAALQDFVLRNWSIVRTGSTAAQKRLFFNLRRLRARLEREGRAADAPTLRDAIAARLSVAPEDVEAMAARLDGPDSSLDAVVSESGSTRAALLVDDAPGPDVLAGERRDAPRRARWIADALATLDPRERGIIERHLLAEPAASLSEIGETLGISKERVRQITVRALGKLREALQHRAGEGRDLLPA